MHLSVVRCTNGTGRVCKSNKQIEEKIKSFTLSLQVSNNYVDFDSFEKPIRTDVYFRNIQLENRGTMMTFISPTVVTLKDSIF